MAQTSAKPQQGKLAERESARQTTKEELAARSSSNDRRRVGSNDRVSAKCTSPPRMGQLGWLDSVCDVDIMMRARTCGVWPGGGQGHEISKQRNSNSWPQNRRITEITACLAALAARRQDKKKTDDRRSAGSMQRPARPDWPAKLLARHKWRPADTRISSGSSTNGLVARTTLISVEHAFVWC